MGQALLPPPSSMAINPALPRRRFRRRRIFFIIFLLLILKVATIGWRTYTLVQSTETLRSALGDSSTLLSAYDRFVAAFGDAYSEWALAFTFLRPLPGDLGLIPVAADLTLNLAKRGREIIPILPSLKTYIEAQSPETWAALLKQAESLSWESINADLRLAQDRWNAVRLHRVLSDRVQPYADAYGAALRLGGLGSEIVPILARRLDQQSFTVLILAQNNDELRATGGFITAIARLQFNAGKPDLLFMNSYAVDNQSRLSKHPAAPAAMQLYMKLPLWVFRDANWSPDYPTSAHQAATLYALDNDTTPDMVISINLNVVRDLTDAFAPLHVEGVAEPLNGASVIDQMRRTWNIKPDTYTNADSKDFLKPFMTALVEAAKQASPTVQAKALTAVAYSLDNGDIFLFSTQGDVQSAIHRYGWDGAQRMPDNDYLMWVESNVGYNKIGPNIQRRVIHHVSLTDPTAIFAQTTIELTNTNPVVSCADNAGTGSGTYEQRMVVCYWALLRAYVPSGATLLSHNLTPIPAESIFTRSTMPGAASFYPDGKSHRVIEGLALVPGAETKTITFTYRLPERVIRSNGDGTFTYHLLTQKQAGVSPYPFELIVDLPANAQLLNSSIPIERKNETTVVFDLESLQPVQEIAITYRPGSR